MRVPSRSSTQRSSTQLSSAQLSSTQLQAAYPNGAHPVSSGDVRAVLTHPDRVSVMFQPILDVRNARTAGWEVLARFDDGQGAAPDRWFSAAYTAGLGVALELVVLRRALPALNRRFPGVFISVNVTPTALGHPEVEALLMSHAPLHGLVLELVEHPVPPSPGPWEAAVARLRDQGALIALDDVGSGYAEIAQMLTLRPHLIKVDRRVVAALQADPARQALLRFLGDFGSALDTWVLAEGVEQPEQLHVLRSLGVPLAQGWLIGSPARMPIPCERSLTGSAPWPPTDDRPTDDRPTTRARHRRGPVRVEAIMRPARLVQASRPAAGQFVGPAVGPGDNATRRVGCLLGPSEAVVQVDPAGVPLAVHTPVAASPLGWAPAPLRVPVQLTVPDAARRAMARPAERRFEPLVCVGPTGEVIGVIEVQDLLLNLAEACDAAPAQSRSGPPVEPEPRSRSRAVGTARDEMSAHGDR